MEGDEEKRKGCFNKKILQGALNSFKTKNSKSWNQKKTKPKYRNVFLGGLHFRTEGGAKEVKCVFRAISLGSRISVCGIQRENWSVARSFTSSPDLSRMKGRAFLELCCGEKNAINLKRKRQKKEEGGGNWGGSECAQNAPCLLKCRKAIRGNQGVPHTAGSGRKRDRGKRKPDLSSKMAVNEKGHDR